MPMFLRWFLELLPANPIAVRLVQGGSRRLRHLYIRAGYLAALIIVLLIMLIRPTAGGATAFRALAVAGASAFVWVAYLQVALICILSPVFMAGAIAQESNPKTWDIMLTTPMSAAQLVLGQLIGRLFFILALLVASMPLFAITQYFGGVPGSAVLASYAVSACAALLVGAIAVGMAVNRLGGRRTVFTFYVSVVTYLCVTIGIDLSLRPPGGGVTLMTPLNPFLALHALLSPSSYPTPDPVALSQMGRLARFWFGSPVMSWCAASGGLSVLIMAVSTITVRNLGSKTGVPWYRRALRLGAKGDRMRAPRTVAHNPIAWREASARQATFAKQTAKWSFIALGVLLGVFLVGLLDQGHITPADYRSWLLVTVWTELIVIMLVAVNVSATAISREREDGTLDLLLTTPITPKDYLGGKLLGIVTYLLPFIAVPIVTLALGSLYVLLGGIGSPALVTVNATVTRGGGPVAIAEPLVLPEAAIIAPLAVVPFLAFVVMIGMNWSMRTKGTLASVVSTVAVAGVVGGIVGVCGWAAGEEVPYLGPALTSLNPLTYVLGSVHPTASMEKTVEGASLTTGRTSLAIGALIALGVYFAVVMGMRTSMTKTFDMTTRRLAGNR